MNSDSLIDLTPLRPQRPASQANSQMETSQEPSNDHYNNDNNIIIDSSRYNTIYNNSHLQGEHEHEQERSPLLERHEEWSYI